MDLLVKIGGAFVNHLPGSQLFQRSPWRVPVSLEFLDDLVQVLLLLGRRPAQHCGRLPCRVKFKKIFSRVPTRAQAGSGADEFFAIGSLTVVITSAMQMDQNSIRPDSSFACEIQPQRLLQAVVNTRALAGARPLRL